MDLIKVAEEAFATGKQHPSFKAGDTITVAYKIIEGSKERIQLFRGVVIKISGHQEKKRFTVRKMSGTVGVERIFPLESPNIESIEVNKVGKVRRAKLYYLRKLTGKAARIKEKRSGIKKRHSLIGCLFFLVHAFLLAMMTTINGLTTKIAMHCLLERVPVLKASQHG